MAVRRAGQSATLERKIHFYRARIGEDEAGRPLPFDARPHLNRIQQLSFASPGRYQTVEEGNVMCCWPRSTKQQPRLVFGVIRRSGLPQLERAGQIHALEIAEAEGLVEAVHVAFYPDNIVGADFNFYGPRMSRLSRYLRHQDPSLDVEFDPLLRADVANQLAKLRDVRVLQLRARTSIADTLARADRSLSDAFRAAAAAGSAEVVDITLSMKPHSRRSLGDQMLGVVRRLAGMPDLRESASAFVVRGFSNETGQVEEVDILRDQLIASKQIVRVHPRGRALDSDSAFRAIAEAHDELGDQLRAAMAIARG